MGWPGPLTHRQYMAWQAWLDMDFDTPDRTAYYLMSVACEVRRGRAANPDEVELEHLRLARREEEAQPVSVAEATRHARARWSAVLGG